MFGVFVFGEEEDPTDAAKVARTAGVKYKLCCYPVSDTIALLSTKCDPPCLVYHSAQISPDFDCERLS